MPRPDEADFRGWRFETFEERLAFSAQPIADFWLDPTDEPIVEPSSAFVEPLATVGGSGAGTGSDLRSIGQKFGLRGSQQTVAIIDSGIAYDHIALGGGFGSSSRVVGGWDFAENDANPYDDGPAGFHGTHVAGIVGANDRRSGGLAPDVDLVALRVFNDQGGGHFQWVEQALAWVHQHRFDFENPITTVNLSLGAEWNASSLPSWATLDDELKQLADDGIFIAVAAGNAFQTMNVAGLSYPAVSQYVTPVASLDASGNLSRFSQRDSRVLAAPGEKIMSTLPDAFFGGDGDRNDWGPSSGTSMASPYVAGASVLVREAMQKLGNQQITPTAITDHLRRTADTIFDPATSATYLKINLERALGSLAAPPANPPTNPPPSTNPSSPPPSRPPIVADKLGLIEQSRVNGLAVTGEGRWFQVTAARSGRLTAEALFANARGNVDLEVYDARERLLGASRGRANAERIDIEATAGQRYFVRLVGGNADVDLRLTNLVTIAGSQVTALGTAAADTIRWQGGIQQQLIVNGVSYRLAAGSQLTIDGRGGHDSLTFVGSSAAETITVRPGIAEIAGPTYRATAASFENVHVIGQWNDRGAVHPQTIAYAVSHVPRGIRLTGNGFTGFVESVGAVNVIGPAATVLAPRALAADMRDLAFALYGLETDVRASRLRTLQSDDCSVRPAAIQY